MSFPSKDFEDNLIKTVIGVVILIVGASLVATSGSLMFRSYYYVIPGALIFIVGIVLIYFSLRVLLSLLRVVGLDLEHREVENKESK